MKTYLNHDVSDFLQKEETICFFCQNGNLVDLNRIIIAENMLVLITL